MTARSLWAGRTLAVLGILLMAANLRTAVASLAPVLGLVEADVPLGSTTVGLLGTLAPLGFAVFALATPPIARRIGLEAAAVLALVALAAGLAGRGLASGAGGMLAASVVAFAAIGVGNAVLPPLVKRYFPDRIGLMTSLYVTVLALSTFLPPLLAVPVADAAGWRVSLGAWAAPVAVALVPWAVLLVRSRAARSAVRADVPVASDVPEEADPVQLRHAVVTPVAWSIAVLLGTSALNVYTMFAWLPELLHDVAGTTAAQNGALLALYALVGAPAAVVVPLVAARTGRVGLLTAIAVACFLAGDLGLLLAPATATWLWVVLAGLGPLTFPLALVLINLRTRTHDGAVALSGFVQAVGYLIAAAFPLLVGVLHEATGGWTVPLVLLTASVVPLAVAGAVAARPRLLEDGPRG